jgi:hypothetical protein
MIFFDAKQLTILPDEIVPMLSTGMHSVTLCVTLVLIWSQRDAERPGRRSHAERGNEQGDGLIPVRDRAETPGCPVWTALH